MPGYGWVVFREDDCNIVITHEDDSVIRNTATSTGQGPRGTTVGAKEVLHAPHCLPKAPSDSISDLKLIIYSLSEKSYFSKAISMTDDNTTVIQYRNMEAEWFGT